MKPNGLLWISLDKVLSLKLSGCYCSFSGVEASVIRVFVLIAVNRNPHQLQMSAVVDPELNIHPVRDKMKQSIKWAEEYKLARVTLVRLADVSDLRQTFFLI